MLVTWHLDAFIFIIEAGNNAHVYWLVPFFLARRHLPINETFIAGNITQYHTTQHTKGNIKIQKFQEEASEHNPWSNLTDVASTTAEATKPSTCREEYVGYHATSSIPHGLACQHPKYDPEMAPSRKFWHTSAFTQKKVGRGERSPNCRLREAKWPLATTNINLLTRAN